MTHPSRSPKYSSEVRERAVRMVFDPAGDYPSQWAAIAQFAAKIGCSTQGMTGGGGAGWGGNVVPIRAGVVGAAGDKIVGSE